MRRNSAPRLLLALLTLASLAAVAARSGRAQDEPERPPSNRLALQVTGRATAAADVVEVACVVLGQGDEAGEAETAHRNKLKAVRRALAESEAWRKFVPG